MPRTASLPEETLIEEKQNGNPAQRDPFSATSDSQVAELVNKISDRIDKRMSRASKTRRSLERKWYRNVLFYAGHHWTVYDHDAQCWRKKNVKKGFPTPVTNITAEKADDNITSLVQQKPQFSFLPETDDPEDVAAARVADRINEVIADESRREKQLRERASWSVITGDAFVESYYDNDPKYGEVFIHHEQCAQCGFVAPPSEWREMEDVCPQCGGEDIQDAYRIQGVICPECGIEAPQEFVGQECPECRMYAAQAEQQYQQQAAMAQIEIAGDAPIGSPMVEQPQFEPPAIGVMTLKYTDEKIGRMAPRGKICSKVRAPFEVFYDHAAVTKFHPEHGLNWVVLIDFIDQETAMLEYQLDEEDLQGKTTRSGKHLGQSGFYIESLATLSSDTFQSLKMGTSAGPSSNLILRETFYELPTKDYPRGIAAIRINGQNGKIVQMSELPYEKRTGEKFIPVVHFPFRYQPGKCAGKSAIDDIIPLQIIRNQTEALMMRAEQSMVAGQWLMPKNVVDTVPTGVPGEVIYYKMWGDGGSRQAKPEKLQGQEPAAYHRYRMEQIDQKIEQLAGSFGVAHGDAPAGITAASALQLLGERQQRAVSTQIEAKEDAEEELARQQLWIFQQFASEPRIERSVSARSALWDVKLWNSADLSGNVDIRVERGSALPRSNAQERASIEALTKLGAMDLMNDQKQRVGTMKKFGLADMLQSYDVDVLEAQMEGAKFMRLVKGETDGETPFYRREIDNHQIHLQEHVDLAKTDEFKELEKWARKAEREKRMDDFKLLLVKEWYAHIQEHKTALAEEMMAQQQMQAGLEGQGSQQGPGRPEGGGAVFSRGARAPAEEEQRSISEPSVVGV